MNFEIVIDRKRIGNTMMGNTAADCSRMIYSKVMEDLAKETKAIELVTGTFKNEDLKVIQVIQHLSIKKIFLSVYGTFLLLPAISTLI